MAPKRKPLSQRTQNGQVLRDKRRRHSADLINCSEEPSTSTSNGVKVRAGTVKQMVLKNFMCHSHLEVDLKGNINYVIGRNGSGKSALLTALVVGLGGKASLTNRGNSIRSFIKAGKNSATVQITLNNPESSAYKHNVYGNSIIVVRNFTAGGKSSYKVKSASGEVVSTRLKEVQQICQNLNIQIDNPVCLLNQDTSRNFLNSKDPRQKFTLFMRATQLETLANRLKNVTQNKKTANRTIKERELSLADLTKEVKQLKKKLDDHKSIATLNNKVVLLQAELQWAKVRDTEEDVNQQKAVVSRLQAEEAEIKGNMAADEKNKLKLDQDIDRLEQQVIELQQSIEEQNAPQNALVHSLGELKDSVNEKRREKRVVLKDIAHKTGSCNFLEQEIVQITENFSKVEQEKMNRMQQAAKIEEKIKEIESLMETTSNDQFQMRNSLSRLQQEENSLKAELRHVDTQIENTHSRLNVFKGESNNLSLYGRDMPKVVDAINAAKNKFEHLPRGPLGSYITIKDKKWAVAVEGFFGMSILRAFTVDNKKDNEMLMSIFNRVWTSGAKPMVITSKFFPEIHDVTPYLVQPVDGCFSVYSAIEISDSVVANCLIDQSSLESILLVPSNEKAIELMSMKVRVPRNCRQAITIQGDKYFPDPNYKTYGSRYHNAQFLQVSTADMVKQLKKTLRDLADKKKTVLNQHKSIQAEFNEQKEKVKEVELKVDKFHRALLQLKRQHDELTNAADSDVANVHTMENELAQLKQLVEQRVVVRDKIEEDLEGLRLQIEHREEQLERIKHIVRGYEDRIEPLHVEIRDQSAKRKQLDVSKRFATNRLNKAQQQCNAANTLLLHKECRLEQFIQEASILPGRPDDLRDVQIISEELHATKRTVRLLNSDNESSVEVNNKYRERKEKHRQLSEFMQTMRDDVKELQVAADNLKRYYEATEDYFVSFVKTSFQQVLLLRQFQGDMEINLDEQKLELIVIPQQGSQGHTTTSNLSGGERSFSTVAFLYALWQCMEFPFYFLDEFDVFMDKVNRSKVMEILQHHAKKNPELQFVFLTPQDVSFINDRAVAIHRLEDPERGLAGSD